MAALDGLRALAVLAVIAFHAEALPGGWLGVEVFFVLSGYLITTLMLAEVGRTETVGLKAFWGRRVRRLWPAICAYLLVTLVIIVPRAIAVTPPTTRHLVATLTWRQNWQMIADGGYGAGSHAGVVEHFWSLSIEEQFYFVWPVVVWAVARWVGRRGVRAAAAVGAAASLALMVWGLTRDWSVDRLYLGSDTRVLGLCVGALFAGVRPTGRIAAWTAGAGVAAILACCWWFGDIRTGNRADLLAGPLQGFTALSVLTIVCAAGLTRGPLVWRPMRAIGRWSFGIYLWHVPIGMIVRTHVADVWWEAIWTAAIATTVAAASYRLIERPVRKRVPAGRWIAVSLTAAAVACVAVGVVEVQQEYHPVAAHAPDDTSPGGSTLVPASAASVVILGDSVPFQAAGELTAAGRAAGFDTVVHAADACILTVDGRDQFWDPCVQWTAELPQAVVGADVVVLWWANTGVGFAWHGEEYLTCDAPETVGGRFDEMIELLALPAGTEVVVVLPSERADQGARDHEGTACQRAATAQWATEHGHAVFDPDPVRLALGSEREVRRDGLHYTTLGAEAVGAALFELVAGSAP